MDLENTPPWPSVKKMETALPGELPVYQTLPGPLATQQGALVGNEGVGPAIGKIFRSSSMMAKLSGLCAGVNPKLFPQNAAPRGTLFASLGRVMEVSVPLSEPSSRVSGSWRTEPELSVTAAHVLPTAICAAEGSARETTGLSRFPEGQS